MYFDPRKAQAELSRRGIARPETARELGVSYTSLRMWLKGWNPMPLARQRQLAEYLGVPLTDLYSDEKWPPKTEFSRRLDRCGHSRHAIGKACGKKRVHLVMWEHGGPVAEWHRPTLCKYLEVSPLELDLILEATREECAP